MHLRRGRLACCVWGLRHRRSRVCLRSFSPTIGAVIPASRSTSWRTVALRLADRLARGDVHLALMMSDARFQQQPLFPLYVLAVLSEKHRLSRHRTLDIVELADEPVLLLNRSFATRGWFEAACSVAHIRPRVLLESAAPHTIIALAGAGYGIAVVPSTVLIPRGSVRAMPLGSTRDGAR